MGGVSSRCGTPELLRGFASLLPHTYWEVVSCFRGDSDNLLDHLTTLWGAHLKQSAAIAICTTGRKQCDWSTLNPQTRRVFVQSASQASAAASSSSCRSFLLLVSQTAGCKGSTLFWKLPWGMPGQIERHRPPLSGKARQQEVVTGAASSLPSFLPFTASLSLSLSVSEVSVLLHGF